MTNEEMQAELVRATEIIKGVHDSLGPTPTGNVIVVRAGQNVQSIVDSATANTVLKFEPAVYEMPQLKVSKALSFMPTTPVPPGRATVTTPVMFSAKIPDSTMMVDGSTVLFQGIGITNHDATGELVNIVGSDILFDRVTGLGDPVNGLHRGFRPHGTRMRWTGCYSDDIFLYGRDAVVLGGWDGGDGIEIDNCYFKGGAETIMFGGADSKSADRIPKNIKITRSVLSKNPNWFAMGVQIKNAFELKSAINVYMSDCVLEYAGIAQGQSAAGLVFTVRNQNGTAPWSVIKNVLIERTLVRYGGSCAQFLGSDSNQPSDTLDGVTLRNVTFSDIDPKGITKGSGRAFAFDRAPRNVTLDGITVNGQNLSALGYFANTPNQPVGLTLSNIKYPKTTYGWKIDNGAGDIPPASKNIKLLMPDLIYNVSGQDVGAIGSPAG
jgi:hypothetical protein